MGITTGTPTVGIAPTLSGNGYWLVGSDGGVFAFGNAGYHGSLPGSGGAASAVVGIEPTTSGGGYWVAEVNGTSPNFGNATNLGSVSPTAPVSGIAA